MINTQDLMLGNYVLYELLAWKVVTTERKGIWLEADENGNTVNIWATEEECHPLPISPVLLEKLNWIRDPVPNGLRFNDPTYKGNFLFMPFVKFWSVDLEHSGLKVKKDDITFCDGHGVRPLQYLHELQNMYRWTQGKRLVIPW